ncbi:uncharacterized protein LOC114294889 [Camellia sinensis]|uniref:uncharacterized protein LOC114294889 n=1 Tax=Camellia sinensis TaxID=4442 RepID=UPI00103649D7|nr:uncharacterized protein LOC114294889 [Camellia sinensis]
MLYEIGMGAGAKGESGVSQSIDGNTAAVDGIANYGPGFKPPSMHELRTWILKAEVKDINVMMEEHKKACKQCGCSIMSDGWTDGKNEIGEDNVVQVITDDASNYVNVGSRLMEKRKKLYWTPCAAHCIDLMLEDIGKLKVCDQTLSLSRQVVKFIYGHCWVLSMMRSFTKNSELLRPVVTRVLREVDSEERPAMGYIYELMDSAKEKITFNCGGNVRKYGPIWNKINARWTPQLHRSLHAAGFYLNPQLHYRDSFSNVEEVKQGLYQCMDRMLSYDERLKADIQLDYYDQAKGEFGSRVAIDSRIHTQKRNRLEHKRLNALVYVKYNTKLRERSIKRRQNIDPILIDEIDLDDEWIVEKEDHVLPLDTSWLDEEELFDTEAIRTVPITTYDRSVENQSTTTTINVDSSLNENKRKVGEGSRNDKGKGKVARCTLVDEDMDLEEIGGIDDGTYPIIDIANEDDDSINEDDLE